MNKKRKLIIISVIILLIGFIIALYLIAHKEATQSLDPDLSNLPQTSSLNKLKEIIISSEYFEKPKFKTDTENNKLTLNDKYDVIIKNGYYMMNIKDVKDEDVYCKIVDAVEMSFGVEKGKSIETCEKTLDGNLNMGGINVEFFETYKVLTVNSEEASTIYNVLNTYKSEELILVEELNYDIQIDKYLFTSMYGGYSDDIKVYSMCGNLYHPSDKEKEFVFTIYDENKNVIGEKNYLYNNSTNLYSTFCVNFENQIDIVKYYSVK